MCLLCCSSQWATKSRMAMAQVTISHGSDDFLMVVRPSQEEAADNWVLLMLRPFMPFTWGAWIGYLLTVLWSLAVYAWLEVVPRLNASDFVIDKDNTPPDIVNPCSEKANPPPENDPMEVSNGMKTEEIQQQQQQQPQHHRRSCRAATRRFAHLSVISMQLAASGLAILGDLAWKPMTYAGKLVYSVIQLFIIATVASYTANLAAVLSTRSTGGFRSLGDAIAAQVPICVPDTLSDMSDLWGLGSLARPVSSDGMLEGIETGLCVVGIMPRLYFEASRGLYGCHEESVATAGILYSKKSHMMAADDLVQPINHALEHLQGRSELLRILEQQWETAWPQISGVPGCSDNGPPQEANGALTFKDMAGLYFLVLAVTAIAAALEGIARFWRPAKCEKEFSFQVEAASNGWYAVALQDHTHIKVPAFFASDSRSTEKPKPRFSDSFYLRSNEMIADFAARFNLRKSTSRTSTTASTEC